ncbi:type III-A CRISPR-associated RAMP protein Csm4 [Synergistales bacterium]|nr:type III-A CRISPR-associated RAMP protein Csm4 [Synergistales bacterium]
MNYAVYKLRFSEPLHIGVKELSDGDCTLSADTIFSALCHEALKIGGIASIERLVGLVRSGKIAISGAMPFVGDDLYIPKPITRVKQPARRSKKGSEDDYGNKKAFKKLKYIPLDLIEDYMAGELDAVAAKEDFILGISDTRARVSVGGDPYYVGSFVFCENAGLYILAALSDSAAAIELENLLDALQYSGLGGKRSSGFGRFELSRHEAGDFKPYLERRKGKLMTLSVCMPRDEELESALDGAAYILSRRGGFVLSETYADKALKKRDFFSFAAGSCFEREFKGDVFDVSRGASHPVWRYAVPFFMGVGA